MLGVMILRTRAVRSGSGRAAGADRIPLATAALGLVWNSGALVIYSVRDLALGAASPWFVALAFGSLGFLPAVVVHSAAQSLRQFRGTRLLVSTAYALSLAAAILQFRAAALSELLPYRPALLALTTGYALLIAVLAVVSRGEPGWRRALSGVALAAFAVMALHLSQHVEGADSWIMELVGHHASLPLALVILYQDYRFALVDLFLKRVLTLVALVALAIVLYVEVAARHVLPFAVHDFTDPRATAGLIALWLLTALAYPWLRRGVYRFVDRLVLRRVDYTRLKADLAARLTTLETTDAILDETARLLTPALSADRITWSAIVPDEEAPAALVLQTSEGRQSARVRIAASEAPSYELEIGPLTGGRRLLSDDFAMLESVALMVARRIDGVRVTQERIERSLRENEILQLATESELRALRAQLNPHFLFNTLTTIGYLMQEAPSRALETLYRLTGLLRAVLRRSDGEFTTLGDEMEIVRSYLSIEAARLEERLAITLDVSDELESLPVPPLVLQPIVENAIKHGIAPRRTGGSVIVTARLEPRDEDMAQLHLTVVDTGVGVDDAQLARRRSTGIGLTNIERRLDRYYHGKASLVLRSAVGLGTTVEIALPVPSPARASLAGASA